jgi:predicted amidophosphoribosyltransferase
MSRSVGEYQGALRAIVHALKYGRHRSLAARLAGEMRRCAAEVLDGADAVVPVPLHFSRQWRRGFNQAELIARHLGPPVWPALRRVRATRPQVDLPADERRRNVLHAFALARGPALAAFRPTSLGAFRTARTRASWENVVKGKVVVLVDDVTTTGSTLEACRAALAAAGAREVRALTAARVPGAR